MLTTDERMNERDVGTAAASDNSGQVEIVSRSIGLAGNHDKSGLHPNAPIPISHPRFSRAAAWSRALRL